MIPAIIWIYVKLNPDMFLNIHLGKKKPFLNVQLHIL